MLKDKIKKFPDSSGVYRFIDKNNKILYIGRATSLKKRVAQYFRSNLDSRISEMVSLAGDVQFEKTDNVLDAIVLEANLIKKNWPKYNIQEKDDRSFVYIIIEKGDYPSPKIIRGKDLKNFPEKTTKVFGPYFNATMIKRALRIIRYIFPYSTCRASQGKPCFDRQIGLCPGVCVDAISKIEYQKNIKNIILLLSGNKKRLLNKLQKENPQQARALGYINDATLITTDKIESTRGLDKIEGYDVSHFAGKETYGSMVVFTGGEADKSQYRLFKIKEAPMGDDLKSLQEMLARRIKHTEWSKPDVIMIDGGRPQVDAVKKVFEFNDLIIPLVGISKYGGDRLVYPKDTKPRIKNLIRDIKPVLLRVREEAHRFGLKASRRSRKI